MNEVKIVEVENEDVQIIIDGAVVSWSEIYGDPAKNKALMDLLKKLLKDKVDSNPLIEADTKCKITYDEKGLVIKGDNLTIEDLPELLLKDIKDVVATADEVNILHGIELTTAELNLLKGLLANAEEINQLHGLRLTTSELNSLIDKVDKNTPITPATKCKITYDEKGLVTKGDNLQASDIPGIPLAKINDVAVKSNELNKLVGLKATALELNQLTGVTDNVQTQINKYINIIPEEASQDNKLADKQFVKDWVDDHAGYYLTKAPNGTPFKTKKELEETLTFYHFDKVKRISENDYAVVLVDETQGNKSVLYAWQRDDIYNEGHWRFQYVISGGPTTQPVETDVSWGDIKGQLTNQTDLNNTLSELDERVETLENKPSTSTTTNWGDIEGTLANQTDLKEVLDSITAELGHTNNTVATVKYTLDNGNFASTTNSSGNNFTNANHFNEITYFEDQIIASKSMFIPKIRIKQGNQNGIVLNHSSIYASDTYETNVLFVANNEDVYMEGKQLMQLQAPSRIILKTPEIRVMKDASPNYSIVLDSGNISTNTYIQGLVARIEQLEAKVATLEGNS